jgi:hypothetical protein
MLEIAARSTSASEAFSVPNFTFSRIDAEQKRLLRHKTDVRAQTRAESRNDAVDETVLGGGRTAAEPDQRRGLLSPVDGHGLPAGMCRLKFLRTGRPL